MNLLSRSILRTYYSLSTLFSALIILSDKRYTIFVGFNKNNGGGMESGLVIVKRNSKMIS